MQVSEQPVGEASALGRALVTQLVAGAWKQGVRLAGNLGHGAAGNHQVQYFASELG